MGRGRARGTDHFWPSFDAMMVLAVFTTGSMETGVSPWDWQHALWLLPMGVLASLGQLCMTKAYAMSTNHSGTLMVANLQYSGIIFSALYGLVLFGDQVPLLGWAGMGLIIVSAIAATVLRARAAPNAPAEEH